MELSTLKFLKTNENFDFNKCKKQELNAIGTYKSRGVKGVKEDCKRFRLQMKILKEKANDSRIREVMVEGLFENLHKNVNEETNKIMKVEDANETIENDQAKPQRQSISKSLVGSTSDLNMDMSMLKIRGKIERNKEREKLFFASSMIKERPNSSSSYPSKFDGKNNHQNNAHGDFKARKRIKTYKNVASHSNTSSSSTSSSTSTLSSLPLSHYIQKLKSLAPISYYPPNSFIGLNKNIYKNEKNTSSNEESLFDSELRDCENKIERENMKNHSLGLSANCEDPTNFDENNCSMQDDETFTNHFNKKYHEFDANTLICIPTSSQFESTTNLGIYACQRAKESIITSLKKNNKISSGDEINKKVGNIMVENFISTHKTQHVNNKILQPISYENDSIQQIIFNELKGLIESFNIQIDAKNKASKTRFDELEKQWDYSKEKISKEILEARHILQNDIKVRLQEIANYFMKKNEDNDEHMLPIMEKKIEKHQLQSDIRILALQNEMKNLWNEIKELTQRKENMQIYANDFIHTIEKSKFEVHYKQNSLKNENNALMKQLQNIKENDMQIEIEKIQKLVEKIQENNVEFERTQSIAHMEGIQERMVIMERVESLSKLYLGGLEEIRSNVSNIKINFHDHVDDIEQQLAKFSCHQECYGSQQHSNLPHHILMKELKSIRSEVGETIEAERDHLHKTLERESINIQHQLKIMCATNKREILTSMRGELHKHLQCAQNKVLLLTNALKHEMDNLRCEIGQTQKGVESLSKATFMIEKEMEIASQAASQATICATKAKDVLNDMQKTFGNEIANVKQTFFQLQENLKFEKDVVLSVANEARQVSEELTREKEKMWLLTSAAQAKNLELNELIQKESLNLVEGVATVKNERDVASQAAEEATGSAVKANEVMCEVSKYFNGQMIKAQYMSTQLKEGIEKDKLEIQKSFEIALQNNQESLHQYKKELELVIKTWKRAMNFEKTMEFIVELDEEHQRESFALKNVAILFPQPDHIQANMEKLTSKTQRALDDLAQSIHKLQVDQEDYHQIALVKQQELNQFKDKWQIEISQLQHLICVFEEKLEESTCEQCIAGKRLDIVENVQVNIVRSYEDVKTITSDLEKIATIWLPKYEVAARVVNELSSKVKGIDEQLQLTCGGGESLMQKIVHIVETKVNGIKDVMIKSHLQNVGIEVKELLERIDDGDRANCHAIVVLENRVNALENSQTCDSKMTLKLECTENCGEDGIRKGNMSSNANLNQSIEELQRNLENIEREGNGIRPSDPNQEFSSKILGLESRIEHVALAAFTNLRLLDKKVEHMSAGIQSALDGAMMADKKCATLGFELVKVFRMFSCKQSSQCHEKNVHLNKQCTVLKMSQPSSKKKDSNEKQDLDSQKYDLDSQNKETNKKSTKKCPNDLKMFDNLKPASSVVKLDISPRKFIKKGLCSLIKEPTSQSSDTQKSTLQYELRQDNEELCDFEDEKYFSKDQTDCFHTSLRSKEYKLHGPLNKFEGDYISCDTTLDEQSILEKCKEGFVKNCQRTNIYLEVGRIHVNVSHRSRGLNQLYKKNDLISVQS